jgi:uncharacterized protein YdeI (YjbR/CyaY-like superfamily)
MKAKPNLNSFYPTNRKSWQEWLCENHESSRGVWLTLRRKKSSHSGLLLDDAVEEALRFGWIDSKIQTQDENFYKLLFTPRKKGSIWSTTNKERVKKLIQEGKMTTAGLTKVMAAKKDGSWDQLTDIENLKVPDDFCLALSANLKAQEHFELLSDSLRKQVLWSILSVKKPETRAKQIQQAVEKLQSGKRNPFS